MSATIVILLKTFFFIISPLGFSKYVSNKIEYLFQRFSPKKQNALLSYIDKLEEDRKKVSFSSFYYSLISFLNYLYKLILTDKYRAVFYSIFITTVALLLGDIYQSYFIIFLKDKVYYPFLQTQYQGVTTYIKDIPDIEVAQKLLSHNKMLDRATYIRVFIYIITIFSLLSNFIKFNESKKLTLVTIFDMLLVFSTYKFLTLYFDTISLNLSNPEKVIIVIFINIISHILIRFKVLLKNLNILGCSISICIYFFALYLFTNNEEGLNFRIAIFIDGILNNFLVLYGLNYVFDILTIIYTIKVFNFIIEKSDKSIIKNYISFALIFIVSFIFGFLLFSCYTVYIFNIQSVFKIGHNSTITETMTVFEQVRLAIINTFYSREYSLIVYSLTTFVPLILIVVMHITSFFILPAYNNINIFIKEIRNKMDFERTKSPVYYLCYTILITLSIIFAITSELRTR